MQMILVNVLTIGFQYSTDGGSINLSARDYEIDTDIT
jgi:hypothetical protein